MNNNSKNYTRTSKRANPVLAIFITVCIDMLGFGILVPVYPLLISTGSSFCVTPDGWSFTERMIMLGWLQAAYPICMLLAAPILGQLSDRHGRRPILALSIFGTAIGYATFALGIYFGNIPLLFIGRALDGMSGGNLAVAYAAIGDISTDKNRTRNFGMIGAAFGLGLVIGPYLGGRLSSPNVSLYGLFNTPDWFNPTTPFLFSAALSLVNCALIFLVFPETLSGNPSDGRIQFSRALSNIMDGFRAKRLHVILATSFFFNAGFTIFTTFFGVYLANSFGFGSSQIGDYFGLIAICFVFSQAVLVKQIAKRLSDWEVLRFSCFGASLMMFGLFFSPTSSTTYLYGAIPFLAFFNGLTMANMTSLSSRSALAGKQGQTMGIFSSVQCLAQVPGAALVGYITMGGYAATPLAIAGLCMALGGMIFFVMFSPKYFMMERITAAKS